MNIKENNIVKETNIVEEINKNLEALDKKLDARLKRNTEERIEVENKVLPLLTQEILNRETNPEELERFSKENLDSLSAQLEATKAYAERYSKTLPERAFCKVKSIAIDAKGAWIDKIVNA